MAVTKRTRYEVLRRDGFRCRYCGATPAEAELRVDHVTPRALGGSDKPDNLVAACHDCNAGKASSTPNEASVAQVSDDDVRWRLALQRAAGEAAERVAEANAYADAFREAWDAWVFGYRDEPAALATDWWGSVDRWRVAGMPVDMLTDSVRIAMNGPAARDTKWRYLCGVVRNRLEELQREAKRHFDDAARPAGMCRVCERGYEGDDACDWDDPVDCASERYYRLGWDAARDRWARMDEGSRLLAAAVDGPGVRLVPDTVDLLWSGPESAAAGPGSAPF